MPLRTPAQCARKYEKTWLAWEQNLRGDLARARVLHDEARLDFFYDRVVVDDAAVERGLDEGSVVIDTRLRDALRRIADGRSPEFVGAVAGRRCRTRPRHRDARRSR